VPISGFVQPAIYENVRKSHTILFVLGGILANAALFGLLLILDRVLPLTTSAQFALIYPVAGAQVWVGFWSLVPARHAVDGAAVGSDGLQLIQILCGTHGSDAVRFYRRRLQRYGATAVGQISASAPLIMEQLARTERWTNPWARNDFLNALQGALATGALGRAEEMLVLDALVTTGLVTGDPEFRPHLDGWTRRAAEVGRDVATLKGGGGAVLVELGHHEAGKALLAQLAAADGIRASDAALVDIFLARAERALGDAAAAQRHADAARQAVERDATL